MAKINQKTFKKLPLRETSLLLVSSFLAYGHFYGHGEVHLRRKIHCRSDRNRFALKNCLKH